MKYVSKTLEEYTSQLTEERKEAIYKLREVLLENLPAGFEEQVSYNMPGFVVPFSRYPDGYHCDTKQPLPFINFASQKNFVALYHMGIYADKEIMAWFEEEYPKHCSTKLDMGKSCVRFKKIDQIPYDLIGELAKKITPEEWIACYEKALKR